MSSQHRQSAHLSLLAAGFLYGASSPLARYIGTWLSPFSVVLVRFVFALPLALLTFNKNDFRNIPKQKLVLFGVLFPISVSLYTLSLFNTKISLAIFSFYIANLMSSIIAGKLIFSEKLSFHKNYRLHCCSHCSHHTNPSIWYRLRSRPGNDSWIPVRDHRDHCFSIPKTINKSYARIKSDICSSYQRYTGCWDIRHVRRWPEHHVTIPRRYITVHDFRCHFFPYQLPHDLWL